MTDKQFNAFVLAVVAVLIWWLIKHRQTGPVSPAESPALPVGYDDPMNNTYASNPGAFAPVTPEQLTLNIANQSAAMLNQRYIPLFGFVGMAQGALYQ